MVVLAIVCKYYVNRNFGNKFTGRNTSENQKYGKMTPKVSEWLDFGEKIMNYLMIGILKWVKTHSKIVKNSK
jgi:hypothetical protein